MFKGFITTLYMDYYELLGVTPSDTMKTIRSHYYKLAKQYHPDKQHNDPHKCESFKHISEAYSTLTNPRKRYLYDLQRDLSIHESPFHFSEEELDILYHYYTTIISSTEMKFLMILLRSLPVESQHRVTLKTKQLIQMIYEFFNNSPSPPSSSPTTICIPTSKTIDCRHYTKNFHINLYRSFHEVYGNHCKEIMIKTDTSCFRLFITHSDYTINLHISPTSIITIQLESILPPHYSCNGYDLYYEYPLSLYQHLFETSTTITLPSQQPYELSISSKPIRLPLLGLHNPDLSSRGDLIISPSLHLSMNMDIAQHHKNLLKTIFD